MVGNLRRLQVASLVLLIFGFAGAAPVDLPPLSTQVSDFAGALKTSYSEDLNRRLTRFAEKTGYTIYIVLMAGDHNQRLVDIAQVESTRLEGKASAGTVLLLIDPKNAQVIITTSEDLRDRFSGSGVEERIQKDLDWHRKGSRIEMEYIVEQALHRLLAQIDPWFYRLDPPSVGFFFIPLPTAEIILIPLAPFLGMMTGIVLISFTAVGNLSAAARFLISGCLGCLIVVAATFLIRQPGGIVPGMFYYGAGMGFAVSGAVAGLRNFWFADQFEGRKPGDTSGPLYFRWG